MKYILTILTLLTSLLACAEEAPISIHLSKNLMSIQANYQVVTIVKSRLESILTREGCELLALEHDLPPNSDSQWSLGFKNYNAQLIGIANCKKDGLVFTGTIDIQSGPLDENLDFIFHIIYDGQLLTENL